MSLQQFSQALLSEHFLIVSGQAYISPESFLPILDSFENPGRKLCLSLPFAFLEHYHDALTVRNIWKGITNIPSLDSHSFTAEVAIRLAKEANVDFVVLGDSVSRHVLYETDHSIAAKIRGLLDAEITPVVCFGETFQEYLRGSTAEIIKEQLSTLLLGLTFDQMVKTILVYKAPWLNSIAPELFSTEYDKAQSVVIETMRHLFGGDAAGHIPLLTDLPFVDEDFTKIGHAIPPSGYFLELGGLSPGVISSYFHILSNTGFKAPPLPPPPLSKTPKRPAKKKTEKSLSEAEETPIPEKEVKRKGRKKETTIAEASEEHSLVEPEFEAAEDSVHDTILSVEHELETPTLHFEVNEHSSIATHEGEDEPTTDSEFELEWYSDEELEALRNEFGIQSDGSIHPKPLPVWDSTRPVRIIKTQAQKAEDTPKPTKTPRKKK